MASGGNGGIMKLLKAIAVKIGAADTSGSTTDDLTSKITSLDTKVTSIKTKIESSITPSTGKVEGSAAYVSSKRINGPGKITFHFGDNSKVGVNGGGNPSKFWIDNVDGYEFPYLGTNNLNGLWMFYKNGNIEVEFKKYIIFSFYVFEGCKMEYYVEGR